MPELPEVETIRRSLLPVVLHRELNSIIISYERCLRNVEPKEFCFHLLGNQFTKLSRRGKYLLFELEDELELIIHLRMTGRLIYYSESGLPADKHTSLILGFADGGALRLDDVRKFATVHLVEKGDYHAIKGLMTLGVEPLTEEFSLALFQAFLVGKQTKIKGLLLDQTKIAGLGNIYADESLFRAGVHPERAASSLTLAEQALLHDSIQVVLKEALANQGTTFRDYRTGYGLEGSFQNKLQIYGKKGECCHRCGAKIEHKKVAGRTSHYCPNCQQVQQ